MTGKPITEMSDEELEAEISRLRAVPIPSPSLPKKPKRLDQTPKKRRSLVDIAEGN